MPNTRRYASREYTAHQIALAKRGNPAQGLVQIDLTGPDGQLKLTFAIGRAALAQAQALDGKYLLGTNAPDLSATQLLTLFKAQDGVEKSNRTLKGPWCVRPLYLHSDQRIESLIFIILLASDYLVGNQEPRHAVEYPKFESPYRLARPISVVTVLALSSNLAYSDSR